MRARSYKGDVIMVRRGRAPHSFTLIPFDDRAIDAIGKVPAGEAFGIRIVRERSLPQHNLFWRVLDKVGRATEFENARKLLVALKIRTGRYDLMMLPGGKVTPVAHSISFAEMSQTEFQEFFDEAMNLICSEVLGGYDREMLLAEASAMLAPRPAPTAPKDTLKEMLRSCPEVVS